MVESASIKIAGDQFNEAVIKYIRRKHNVLIGERTAEELKMSIGCVYPREEEQTMEIKGRDLMTGLPRAFTVSSSEMIEAFEEPTMRILEAVHSVLERTPPELVADISNNGIVMTGGGSLIWGIDRLIEQPHRHRDPRGRRRHLLRRLRHRQEPGGCGKYAGRHHEPVSSEADEYLIDIRTTKNPGIPGGFFLCNIKSHRVPSS